MSSGSLTPACGALRHPPGCRRRLRSRRRPSSCGSDRVACRSGSRLPRIRLAARSRCTRRPRARRRRRRRRYRRHRRRRPPPQERARLRAHRPAAKSLPRRARARVPARKRDLSAAPNISSNWKSSDVWHVVWALSPLQWVPAVVRRPPRGAEVWRFEVDVIGRLAVKRRPGLTDPCRVNLRLPSVASPAIGPAIGRDAAGRHTARVELAKSQTAADGDRCESVLHGPVAARDRAPAERSPREVSPQVCW